MQSTDIKTPSAKLAQHHGYRLHHDYHGWYVVAPDEDEPENGSSLGFDGRVHYLDPYEGWRVAARLAQGLPAKR